jgi:hypothetical protein
VWVAVGVGGRRVWRTRDALLMSCLAILSAGKRRKKNNAQSVGRPAPWAAALPAPCPRPAAFSRCITCSQYHVNYRVIVTIFGFNYALGGGFYLASGLPISSPLHPPSCMPEVEKGKKKEQSGRIQDCRIAGIRGGIESGQGKRQSLCYCGGEGGGECCDTSWRKRIVIFRRAVSVVSRL